MTRKAKLMGFLPLPVKWANTAISVSAKILVNLEVFESFALMVLGLLNSNNNRTSLKISKTVKLNRAL